MKTILVPTDFSTNADNALDYAIELAQKSKSKLILLNVYFIIKTSYVSQSELKEELTASRKDSINSLKILTEKISQKGDISYEILSIEGLLYDTILDIIKEKKVDLVIMGTKGATDLAGAIFGSNTAKIIEKASCPVIAVPSGSKFAPVKNITFATNYNDSDVSILEKVVEIARIFNAQIDVLHICNSDDGTQKDKADLEVFRREADQKIDYKNISFQLISDESIEEALENYLAHNSTGMLAMSTHRRNLFDKIFGKSITNHMAYHSNIPLMAFHFNKETAVKLI